MLSLNDSRGRPESEVSFAPPFADNSSDMVRSSRIQMDATTSRRAMKSMATLLAMWGPKKAEASRGRDPKVPTHQAVAKILTRVPGYSRPRSNPM